MTEEDELPKGYELFFQQATGIWSIWYTEKEGHKPVMIMTDFKTRKEARDCLLNSPE